MAKREYSHRGGKHIDTTVLMNALAHVGVANPRSGEPFSEAAIFGMAGGIGGGLSFCPSVLRRGKGAGISIVGRFSPCATAGDYHKTLLDRLGVPYRVTEASTPRAAQKKLVAELEGGYPVIAQCSKGLTYYGGRDELTGVMMWAWDVLVYDIDEDAGIAIVGDVAHAMLPVPLDNLAEARNQTCTHKNRLFTLQPRKKKLTAAEVKSAMSQGIRACIAAQRQPRIKTFALGALAQWARQLRNTKAKSGWLRTFEGGKLFWALRDVFASIETNDTGGGLMRPLYADFLTEASEVLRKKALAKCADDYRLLGEQWTKLAEAALPSKIKPFASHKKLLRKQVEIFEKKGPKAYTQMDKNWQTLAATEKSMVADFPLDADSSGDLLASLADQVEALHAAEVAALDRLDKVIG